MVLGTPHMVHEYFYEGGVYAGYEGQMLHPATNRWQFEGSMRIEWVSDTVELVHHDRYRGAGTNGTWQRTYDDSGNLLEHRFFAEDGTVLYWRTFRYEHGRRVETVRYDASGNVEVGDREDVVVRSVNGELRPVRVDVYASDRLRTRTDFYYYPTGVLASFLTVIGEPEEVAVLSDARTLGERYDPRGRLIEESSGLGTVISTQTFYFWEGELLVRSDMYSYSQPAYPESLGPFITRCVYIGHDQYGNWTEKRCTRSVPLDEVDSQWEPFRGGLLTREFTYHEP